VAEQRLYVPPPDLAWVEPGLLAVGSLPYPSQRPGIAALGIRVVVSLLEPGAAEASAWAALGVDFHAVPTRDWVHIPHGNLDRVVRLVERCAERGTPLLLHCAAGVNRAPTFAAAVLCRRHDISVEQAIQVVRRARPAASPTEEQAASLREWLRLRQRGSDAPGRGAG
jgi:atypical dual specificity phosphatase